MASMPSGAASQQHSAPDISEDRETYVGGSEAFELLGFPQYGRGCARALAYRKLQTPEDVPQDRAARREISLRGLFKRGHMLEDVAAKLYTEHTGRSLMRRNRLVRHPDHPGAAVHPDRFIPAIDLRGTGDAEIKTHGEGPFFHILRDGLPPAHNLQIQWSLFCTQHKWGSFIILGVFGELPLKYFDVERDPALMNIFAVAIENFWAALKAGDLPPQLEEATDMRCKVCPFRLTCRGESLDPEEYHRLMAEREGKKALKAINNEELNQALADRALILSEIEALTHESDEDPGALQLVTSRIKELVGEESALLVNKNWKVYCNENTWSGIDMARLKREQPAVYEKYFVSKRPTGTKRLRVYALHDGKAA